MDCVGFGFQVVVVEWLGFAFTKEGSAWTKVVFKVLGSSEKEEEWERREEGRKKNGKGEKRGGRRGKKEKWVPLNFFKIFKNDNDVKNEKITTKQIQHDVASMKFHPLPYHLTI